MERGFDVCSPRGGRHSRKSNWSMATIFLSTPSARRATLCRWAADHRWRISIHALREEGDATARDTTCRRMNFYPRPPRGGRRRQFPLRIYDYKISIHALREEGDMIRILLSTRLGISIHALREEGDQKAGEAGRCCRYFYPRPPRGGRLACSGERQSRYRYFYPRPPRGGRQRVGPQGLRRAVISIHALREEGDTGPRCRPAPAY